MNCIRTSHFQAKKTLKNHCYLCLKDIAKGQYYRVSVFSDSDQIYSLYEHELCWEAMDGYMSFYYGHDWEYSEGDLRELKEELLEFHSENAVLTNWIRNET